MASASSSLISRYRALIRSSLVLKYVNRVPSATPACFDISDVGAAVRPRSANRRVAASRIAFRLSSLLGRATGLLYYLSAYSIIQRKHADEDGGTDLFLSGSDIAGLLRDRPGVAQEREEELSRLL